MSFCVASYFTAPQGVRPHPPLRLPRQSKARLVPTAVLRCSRCGSPASRIGNIARSYNARAVALSGLRRTDGRRRTIHSGTTPTPFSAATGHCGMSSLAPNRTRYVFRASRRGSKRKVVFEEGPVAAGVVGSVDRRSKALWENRFLVFPQRRHFPQRFRRPNFHLRWLVKRASLKKAPQVSAWG